MASRLADILQQEYKTKGLIGGAASALNKSRQEKSDIRNMLFGGSGLGSIVGRKVFGKGYSATSKSNIANASVEAQSLNTPILEQINQNLSYLPAMAKDMNLLRQNFSKFLISQRVSPANAPDKYFEKAKQRENIYESGFNKGSKGTTPTKIEKKEENNKGVLGGLLSGFGGLLGGTFSAIGSVAGGLIFGITKLGSSLALALVGGFLGTLRAVLGKSRIGKIMLGLLGLGAVGAGANALADTNIAGSIDDALAGLIDPENFGPGKDLKSVDTSNQNQGSILDAAGYGLGAYASYQGAKFTGTKLDKSINRPESKAKFGELYDKKTTTSMIVDEKGKPITTTQSAKKLPLTELQEKMGKRVVEMQKKGWFSRLMSAILKKFGIGLVARISVLLGSISASVATGGVLAPALAIANAALWGVFLYELYQFIEECYTIWSRDENEEGKNTSPTLESPDGDNLANVEMGNVATPGTKPTQTGINVPRTTSAFGERRGNESHKGVDLGAKTPGVSGDPIYSTGDGEVIVASSDARSGNYIKIKHSDGTESLYAHLQRFSVKSGQKVKKGEQIGEMGSTGNSSAPHLHYEKRDNKGKSINPTQEELYAAINSSTQMAALQQQNPRGSGFSDRLNSYATNKALANQPVNQVVNNNVNTNQANQKPQQETFAALPTIYDTYFSNKLVSRTTL